jgi:hypothetical protein
MYINFTVKARTGRGISRDTLDHILRANNNNYLQQVSETVSLIVGNSVPDQNPPRFVLVGFLDPNSDLQCCGSGMIFFGSGSGMNFFIISKSVSASRELHGKLALYSLKFFRI